MLEIPPVLRYMRAMQTVSAAPMPIPGHFDPVPVARAVTPRPDGRIDLVGLSKDELRETLAAAGLEPRQAKLRAKQIWHWIYNLSLIHISEPTRPY